MKFNFLFKWFDFWVGAYYDVGHKTLYINPLPMCVFRFEFSGIKDESKHRQDRQTRNTTFVTKRPIPLELEMNVEIKITRLVKFRYWLATRLFKIGAWIIDCSITVEQ